MTSGGGGALALCLVMPFEAMMVAGDKAHGCSGAFNRSSTIGRLHIRRPSDRHLFEPDSNCSRPVERLMSGCSELDERVEQVCARRCSLVYCEHTCPETCKPLHEQARTPAWISLEYAG